MTGFSTSSCFSPAHNNNTSTTRQVRLGGFLTALIASLGRLAAKLKLHQGGSPKKFVTNVSHKATKMVHRRNNRAAEMNKDDQADEALWQRAILMGDKCQPLDFSGVIYYDESGKQISELPPRSPRSPLPCITRTHL
ncbi:hypothetical protein QQ045_014701 [Rhodiola kirilowii]